MESEKRKQFETGSCKASDHILRFISEEVNGRVYVRAEAMCGLVNVMALLSVKSGISFEDYKKCMLEVVDFYESRWEDLKKDVEEGIL